MSVVQAEPGASGRRGGATPLPQRVQVVVIGGGIAGCATAYHLTCRGWRDVLVLERRRLTSGTTWHAAGW